jgi:hypothetical protein
MDFKMVLKSLIDGFDKDGIQYALLGGFALGLWGRARMTADLDFLVRRVDCDRVDVLMKNLGYECVSLSENFGHYSSALKIFGFVDFLYASRPSSLDMLNKALVRAAYDGELQIKVLSREGIIAFKLQAILNNPSRESKDMMDIRELLSIDDGSIDWSEIERYGRLLGMDDIVRNLKKEFEK